MKAIVVAVTVLVLGDFAINHGDFTHAALQMLGGFWRWLSRAAAESLFND